MDISPNQTNKRNRPPEKSIRFPVSAHNKLLKLSEKFGRNQSLLFVQMVEYFYRSSKDPLDIGEEQLRKALSRNHDAYTSFIKSQEKVLLIPMRVEMERMIKNQEQIVSFFNDQVLKANKSLLENQQVQIKAISESEKMIKVLYQDREIKRILQQKFLIILDTYIKNRENLGSFKTREKEELVELARKQIAAM
ncbi:BfmA/BtgA family mobilization protein [Pedobacter gandavensis]|uniref:BfmA/BtgA family mobilization protein n=1 Tax=Pedobacter gandavensis TaxID=2679963 RepID=UPI002478D571|nr:BfmA/BtgA family mobilization protein [Pedobacter gandavensis]WGQ09891.1 BfmA/BtgA family mobilization protein [Pedobacter gandavensis]